MPKGTKTTKKASGGRRPGSSAGTGTMDFPLYDLTREAVDTLGTYIGAQEYPPPGLHAFDGTWNWSGLLQSAVVKLAQHIRAGGEIEPDTLRGYLEDYEKGKTVAGVGVDRDNREGKSERILVHLSRQMFDDAEVIARYLLTFEERYQWAKGKRIRWARSFNNKLVVVIALFWNRDYVRSKAQ